MITVRCPSCQAEVRGPESIVGKRVRCKRDDCRNVFVFETPPPPVSAPVDEPWDREAPALASSSYDDEFDDDESPAPLPKRKKKKTDETSEQRYPQLHKYLEWWRTAAIIVLALYLLGAALVTFSCLLAPLYSDGTAGTVLATMLLGILAGAGISVVGYITYIFTLALIQFIHVIIDIEDNTRRLAG